MLENSHLEQFLIQSQSEIMRILKSLIQQRAVVSASLEGSKTTLVTALLAVDPARNLIVLDYGPDPRTNERVLAAKKLFCITKLDHVEVKFTVHEVKQAALEGQPVFCAPLPKTLYYPQRRRFYRLTLPKTSPLQCSVRLDDGSAISLQVLDLSVGGLGLLDSREILVNGGIYPNCRLALLGLGEVSFDLEVRALLNGGEAGTRACCAFHNLKPDHAMLIQRYLNQQQIKMRQTMPERR